MQRAAPLLTSPGNATEARSRDGPTLTPARSIDSYLSKTAKGGAGGFFPA